MILGDDRGSYIARCEGGIQEVPKDSALGRLRGSDNVDERRLYDYMDPQPDINARVRASNFSRRLNYLKRNESYSTSHSCEMKRNFLGFVVTILSIVSTPTLN
ncbi:hypothetical protein AABB24_039105 [Solanum stoloniferum]|uniref:Uncharacterized protein n=1 Tax=Solanum stoloniferum TaxID=62892 RepID=A0ABD2R394_9SOLN